MKRYCFWLVVIFFSLVIGSHILNLWRGIVLSRQSLSKESLLKAIKVNPDNPDPFHKLGILNQWNLIQVDLKESEKYFQKALERNPLEQEYWLNLAKVLQQRDERDKSVKALEKAIQTFPTSYRGRWMTGNLLLQQGAIEKAISHFSFILSFYPNQSGFVYDVWSKVASDPDFIMERLVPKDPSSFRQYLSYLYDTGDKESLQKAWQKKDLFGYKAERKDTIRYIEFLIFYGDFNEAFQIWRARLHEEGIPIPSDGNLITNGGFEEEKILGGGFDWKIERVPGAAISFDHSMTYNGKGSLRIVFNGKENVDFYHVSQFVPLKPNSEYALKAHMKTKDVTTKSGLKIEISGVHSNFYGVSESLNGDNGWKELTVLLRTPAQAKGGLVRIRRNRTDKFDRFISGTVWIDNVRLVEK